MSPHVWFYDVPCAASQNLRRVAILSDLHQFCRNLLLLPLVIHLCTTTSKQFKLLTHKNKKQGRSNENHCLVFQLLMDSWIKWIFFLSRVDFVDRSHQDHGASCCSCSRCSCSSLLDHCGHRRATRAHGELWDLRRHEIPWYPVSRDTFKLDLRLQVCMAHQQNTTSHASAFNLVDDFVAFDWVPNGKRLRHGERSGSVRPRSHAGLHVDLWRDTSVS